MRAPARRGQGVYILLILLAIAATGGQGPCGSALAVQPGASPSAANSNYDLSADTLMIENGETQEGKIYIKGDKYRIQRKGEEEYIILRHDKGIMWVVMPKEKIYVELPLDPSRTPRIQEKNPGETSRQYLGSEVLDGHPVDKYRITVKEGAKTESFHQWTATDLNFPVKTAGLKNQWAVEFTNIKKHVPDSLFDIPEGYQKAKVIIKPPKEGPAEKEKSLDDRPSNTRYPR